MSGLAAESHAVGVPVTLIADDPPPRAAAVVTRTAYRVVQEALTNVRKHAPGAAVTVQARISDGVLHLSVSNTPPAGAADGAPPLAGTGTGGGLAGLQRRVAMLNGTLRAGPSPQGGFTLHAALPVAPVTGAGS